MQREAPAYLRDVVEACDAIDSVLSGVEFDEYHATRMLRSSVEREFTIIGEAVSVLSRTESQLFARITNGRRIVDFRNQLTHAYLQVDDRIVWLIARTMCRCCELSARSFSRRRETQTNRCIEQNARGSAASGRSAASAHARCVRPTNRGLLTSSPTRAAVDL